MKNDDFDKLFLAITELDRKITDLSDTKADKDDIERVLTTLDAMRGQTDTDDEERAAIVSQLDRHEHWIEKASKTTNIRYPIAD